MYFEIANLDLMEDETLHSATKGNGLQQQSESRSVLMLSL